MYRGLRDLHSLNRYLVLILVLAVVISSLYKWLTKKEYSKGDNTLNLVAFISTHIQLLTGLLLYGMSSWVDFTQLKEKAHFFFTIEHLTGMLIAIALVTIGRIKVKKIEAAAKKHKQTFWYFFIALVLILASIPWPFRHVGIDAWF